MTHTTRANQVREVALRKINVEMERQDLADNTTSTPALPDTVTATHLLRNPFALDVAVLVDRMFDDHFGEI